MDYIQSVLTRQRQLLSLLLLGGGREAADAASAEDVPAQAAGDGTAPVSTVDGAMASWAGDALSAMQGTPGSNGDPAARRAARASVGWAAEFPGGGALNGGSASAVTFTGGQTPVGAAAVSGGGTLAGESGPVSYVLPSGAAVPSGTGLGARAAAAASAAGAAVSARELSRAIERDARRYDGGFSLY